MRDLKDFMSTFTAVELAYIALIIVNLAMLLTTGAYILNYSL